MTYITSSCSEVFCKKFPLKILQYSQENTCARVSLQASASYVIKKETLVKVFSCDFCEILRTPFFIEYLRWLLLLYSPFMSIFSFVAILARPLYQVLQKFSNIKVKGRHSFHIERMKESLFIYPKKLKTQNFALRQKS